MPQALDPVTRQHIENVARGVVAEFAGAFSRETIQQGQSLDSARRSRDDLDRRVQTLIGELTSQDTADAS